MLRPGLGNEHRPLPAGRSNSHKRRAENGWMLVENPLAGLGVQYAALGLHPMCDAATKPESVLRIEVARVAHAMPEVRAVLDFGERVVFHARDVLGGDDRP